MDSVLPPVAEVRLGVYHIVLWPLLYFFHIFLLLTFSLQFSSSNLFRRSIFRQSSHPSCGLPRLLQPPCFFLSPIFGTLSSDCVQPIPSKLNSSGLALFTACNIRSPDGTKCFAVSCQCEHQDIFKTYSCDLFADLMRS